MEKARKRLAGLVGEEAEGRERLEVAERELEMCKRRWRRCVIRGKGNGVSLWSWPKGRARTHGGTN